jgi:conjugal transfer pilus assembly protein TraW
VRAWPILATGFTLLSLTTLAPLVTTALARDHGVMGQTWPIVEPDLLATIDTKLRALEGNGSIERMQRELVAKTENRVRNPLPVPGISATQKDRSWMFDPSIVVEADVRDQKGNVIAARGARVNPLALIDMTTDLIFVDGSEAGQLEWATNNWASDKAKIIFVSGSPFDRMGEFQRRFFFDQHGKLTSHFGIAHVPAVVSQKGQLLEVREIVLPTKGGS